MFLLAMFPRTVYAQTLPVSSSSLGGRESPLWKTPSWASPSEREKAGGAGTHETLSTLMTGVCWTGSWERARLHQTGPEGLEPDCRLRKRRGLISQIQ